MLEHRVEGEARGWLTGPVDRGLDVLGRQRRAVVVLDVLAQVKPQAPALVQRFPAFRKPPVVTRVLSPDEQPF